MFRPVTLGSLLALALASCDPGVRLGGACDFNSDCPADLVCGHARCREACRVARDCGPGLRCVVTAGDIRVCTLDREESCGADVDCAGDLRCSDRECRTGCTGDSECTENGVCVAGACVEPVSGEDAAVPEVDAGAACTDAPIVCGDGRLDACASDRRSALLAALTGASGGEIAVLTPLRVDGILVPRVGASGVLPPQTALAATGAFGAVAWIAGAERAIHIRRFATASPDAATPVALAIGADQQSLDLSEDGQRIVGVAVLPMPAAGTNSGNVFEIEASGDARIVNVLAASDPARRSWGRIATIGGVRSMLGTSHPRFQLNRETVGGSWTIGALDTTGQASNYRTIATSGFTDDGYLDNAGSAGTVLVTFDPERLFDFAAWQPTRTPAGTASPTAIRHIDVTDTEVLGPPSLAIADAAGVRHVLAFPTTGATALYRLDCPLEADCLPPERLSWLATTTGQSPIRVAIARVASGYAYAVIAPTAAAAGAPRVVSVGVASLEGSDVALFDDATFDPDLLGTSSLAGEIVDVRIHAVDDGEAITVLVAVLARDERLGFDELRVGGWTACRAR